MQFDIEKTKKAFNNIDFQSLSSQETLALAKMVNGIGETKQTIEIVEQSLKQSFNGKVN